jgi:hypothetical protein
MRRCSAALIALYALVVAMPARAQIDVAAAHDSTVSVRLRDGSIFNGRIVSQTMDSLRIVTSGATVTLARSAVLEIKLLRSSELHGGTYWAPDPHDTRLFFGPTGRTLSRGSGYFSDQYLLLVNGAWGVTDRITIGAGMSLVPVGDFFHNNVYYLMPKVALVRGDSFNLAAGAIVFVSGLSNVSGGVGYVAATSGGADASFTYGLGFAYVSGNVPGDLTVMLGGNKRIARRVSLMSENYVFTNGGYWYWLPIYGVRFIGDKLSTDLGFVNYTGRNAHPVFPGVPWLGFALKF